MLQNNTEGSAKKLLTKAWLLAIEMEEGVELDEVSNALVGSLRFMEGIGKVEADCIGVVPEYEDGTEDLKA